MHTLKSATEKTITCPECGFKWHRSGGRGNQAFKLEPKEPRSLTASYPEVRSDHHHVNSFRTAPSLCADMIFGKDSRAFSRQESPFCLSLRLDAPRRRRFQLIHSYLDKGIEHCPCSL